MPAKNLKAYNAAYYQRYRDSLRKKALARKKDRANEAIFAKLVQAVLADGLDIEGLSRACAFTVLMDRFGRASDLDVDILACEGVLDALKTPRTDYTRIKNPRSWFIGRIKKSVSYAINYYNIAGRTGA